MSPHSETMTNKLIDQYGNSPLFGSPLPHSAPARRLFMDS